MAMTGALATHYARALADAVFGPEAGLSPQDAVDQMRSVDSLISGSAELKGALLSPAVNKRQKSAVVSRLADELGLHRLLRNFLLVIVSHRRIHEMSGIRQQFEAVVDERLGWMPADITSAQELSPEQKQKIEEALGSKLGKFIRPNYQVDPGLLAGLRARVASKEYDASLRGKLEGMRQRLAAGL
jgi:F-type H+-transporting ATPase subunit delta